MPPVYLLEQEGINAFAAGWEPDQAVLGFTRGAVRELSRDELQGVAAHEFSHVLNGDMRLNLRLFGLLFGLLLLALTGRTILGLFRHLRFSGGRGRGNNGAGAVILGIILLGLALLILGWIGVLVGRMIQAALSRQREYLADASAVQFTRNPEGLGGALKRIKGRGSRVRSPTAEEASHLFVADGLRRFSGQLLATHPPLEQRIRRIEPGWDGTIPAARQQPDEAPAQPVETAERKRRALGGMMAAAAVTALPGTVLETSLEAVRAQQAAMPVALRSAAHDPFTARAAVLVTVLHQDDEQRRWQESRLEAHDPVLAREVKRLWPEFSASAAEALRLPLLRMAVPALRQASPAQRQTFSRLLDDIIDLDGELHLRELVARRVLSARLRDGRPRSDYLALRGVVTDCRLLLGALALDAGDPERQAAAFAAGWQALGLSLPPASMPGSEARDCRAIDRALDRLDRSSPAIRGRVLSACAAAAGQDGTLTEGEILLVGLMAEILHCPQVATPPLVSVLARARAAPDRNR